MTGERMLLPGRALRPDLRSLRALLLLGSIVLLLIAGLLGMHVLGSSAAGHGASAPAAATVGHHAAAAEHDAAAHAAVGHQATVPVLGHAAVGHAAAVLPPPAPAADDAPAAPSHEHGMLMACVLALLAGLIVLARPAAVRRSWLSVALRPASSLRAPAARAGLPPPSLILLSISRT